MVKLIATNFENKWYFMPYLKFQPSIFLSFFKLRFILLAIKGFNHGISERFAFRYNFWQTFHIKRLFQQQQKNDDGSIGNCFWSFYISYVYWRYGEYRTYKKCPEYSVHFYNLLSEQFNEKKIEMFFLFINCF